ncbi:MAG TPA: serine hydrolase domain-containing protein [Propionibacteriaceae bacterium]|nr:serine hydrolase domain-containing protein [Propionibacteriaceae bacterium]
MSLEAAWDLVQARHKPAQLVVLYDGQPVLDRAMLCARNDLFWLFSAGKPYLAVLVRQLVERGEIDLDQPVAHYWPEFGAHGKEGVTVRDVVRHRSGVSTAGNPVFDAAFMPQWDWSLQRLVKARLKQLEPGRTAYGFVSFGFILGEVVQRVTRRPLAEVMRELVLEPLGVHDTYLGLPAEAAARAVMLQPSDLRFTVAAAFCNQPHVRSAVIPAAGVSATARDVAIFYETLRRGGSWGERHLLQPESIAAMLVPTSGEHRDLFTGTFIRWSEGFQLGGPRPVESEVSALGALSSPYAYGHNGSDVCIGWADPTRKLVMAYLTGCFGDLHVNLRHMAAVGDAVLAWHDGVHGSLTPPAETPHVGKSREPAESGEAGQSRDSRVSRDLVTSLETSNDVPVTTSVRLP